jgi:hypothetical protein
MKWAAAVIRRASIRCVRSSIDAVHRHFSRAAARPRPDRSEGLRAPPRAVGVAPPAGGASVGDEVGDDIRTRAVPTITLFSRPRSSVDRAAVS